MSTKFKLFGIFAIAGGLLAAAFGSAATLSVSGGTAASGSGSVASCGDGVGDDVTGSTYILFGQTVTTLGDDTVTGMPSDITKVQAVNIETDDGCDQLNAFIQVKDGATLLATGSCTISKAGGVNGGTEDDGLGFDEASIGDNVTGCTADLNVDPNVVDIDTLVVTIT